MIAEIWGLSGKTADYNVITKYPWAMRSIAKFIHKTDLLGQFCEAKLIA